MRLTAPEVWVVLRAPGCLGSLDTRTRLRIHLHHQPHKRSALRWDRSDEKSARPKPGGLCLAVALLGLLLLLEDEGVSLIGDLGEFREQEGVSYLCSVNQQRATQ